MRRVGYIAFGFVVSLVWAGYSHAIPAFARQYSLSCSTCHVAYPKLKPFGEDFAANDYVLGGYAG